MKWLTRELKFQPRRKVAPYTLGPLPPLPGAGAQTVPAGKPQTPSTGSDAYRAHASAGQAQAPASRVSPPAVEDFKPATHASSPAAQESALGEVAPAPQPASAATETPWNTSKSLPDPTEVPDRLEGPERQDDPPKPTGGFQGPAEFGIADESESAKERPTDQSEEAAEPGGQYVRKDLLVPEPLVPRVVDEPRPVIHEHPKLGLVTHAVSGGSLPPESDPPVGAVSAGFGGGPEDLREDPGTGALAEDPRPGPAVSDRLASEPLVPRVVREPGQEPSPLIHAHSPGGTAVAVKPNLRVVPTQPEPTPTMQPQIDPLTALEDSSESQPSWNGLRHAQRAGRSKRLIGDVVVDLGFADRETVEGAVAGAKSESKPTGQILVERGILRSDQLAQVVAERFGLDYVDLSVYDVDAGASSLLPVEAITRYQAVPVGFVEDGTLLLAMADPTNVLAVDDISMMTNRRVRVAVASAEDVRILIAKLGRMEQSIEDIVDEDQEAEQTMLTEEADQDAPVIKLVHSIVAQAVAQGASDIHINPEEGDTHILFRIDGVLYPAATIRRRMAMSMVSRIKIMSDLDISERRAPQDGRFALTIDRRRIDVRVVTLPLVHGEGAVMRILDKGVVVPNLGYLGMQSTEQDNFDAAIHRPNGAVLVTGPTGSGKSTTLYAALNVLNDGSRSILTIEDPVESRIAGIKQMQIAAKAGVTFETGLRSMLRADPDVIMVGEIRDRETAHIAVEAALTGHMVLSTLHTRDAPSALGRLADMGIEPFLISSAIDCVVAQRLVRMLCQHCKRLMNISATVLEKYDLQGSRPYEPVGCSRCGGSGYRGRVGLYEVMLVNEEIRNQILEHASVDEIAATAVRNGMRRLHDDGMEKVRAGQTSIAEVERMAASLL